MLLGFDFYCSFTLSLFKVSVPQGPLSSINMVDFGSYDQGVGPFLTLGASQTEGVFHTLPSQMLLVSGFLQLVI